MEKQYIGIKHPTPGSKAANLQEIWTLGEDGYYRCPHKPFVIPKWAVESDLQNGFLKPYQPKQDADTERK